MEDGDSEDSSLGFAGAIQTDLVKIDRLGAGTYHIPVSQYTTMVSLLGFALGGTRLPLLVPGCHC